MAGEAEQTFTKEKQLILDEIAALRRKIASGKLKPTEKEAHQIRIDKLSEEFNSKYPQISEANPL